jgi:hypothetical protein
MGNSQAEREQPVTPLELFFDPVFAFMQVTTFLSHSSTGVVCSGHSYCSARSGGPSPAYAWLTNTVSF